MATGVGAGSLFPPPGLPPGKLGAEEGAGIFSGVNQHESMWYYTMVLSSFSLLQLLQTFCQSSWKWLSTIFSI